MEAAGHRLSHGGLLVGKLRREGVDLRFVYGAVFGKAAVDGSADAGHILAEMADAALAVGAGVAKLIGVDTDPVTGLHGGDFCTNLHHLAGKFVAQNGACRGLGSALVAVEDMYICAADAAGMDFDEHIVFTHFRHGKFLNSQVVFLVKYSSFHRITYFQLVIKTFQIVVAEGLTILRQHREAGMSVTIPKGIYRAKCPQSGEKPDYGQ